MATANIRAVITAEDRASSVVSKFGQNISRSSGKIVKDNQTTAASFNQVLVATAGLGVATRGLVGVINDSVRAANKEQAALTGLSSITKAFKQDTNAALEAAKNLAEDGLMTVGDAALGLKNLLAAGFNLDQAIKLMIRFKDTAAFGKQAALTFGQAVTSATEGIKNGNSILVDNAGLTKNLSVILEEAGFSAQDLMRATTDASVRQALFTGILKESNPMVGDAAKLTELYAGKQAQLSAKTEILKARIGEALQPALLQLVQTITPIVERFAAFAANNPKVVAAILLATTAFLGLATIIGTVGLAIKGLSPLLGLFAAKSVVSTGIAKGAFIGLRSILISMGAAGGAFALVAAAGVGAAVAIALKWRETRGVIASTTANIKRSVASIDDAMSKLQATLSGLDQKAAARAQTTLQRMGVPQSEINKSLIGTGANYAAGTSYHPGGMALVGEQGPEIVNLPRGSSVTPNHKLGGGTINLNVNVGMYAGTEIEKRKIAKELLRAAQDLANSQGMTINSMFGA